MPVTWVSSCHNGVQVVCYYKNPLSTPWKCFSFLPFGEVHFHATLVLVSHFHFTFNAIYITRWCLAMTFLGFTHLRFVDKVKSSENSTRKGIKQHRRAFLKIRSGKEFGKKKPLTFCFRVDDLSGSILHIIS